MTLYQKILESGSAIIEQLQIPLKVRKQRNKLQGIIIEQESIMSSAQLELEKLQSVEEIDWKKLIDKEDEYLLAKRRYEKLKEWEKKLFGELQTINNDTSK